MSERLAGEILHPVVKRIGAGHDGGVRRRGQRNLSKGVLIKQTVAGERIESGSLYFRVAIAAEMVGAQSIHRYQNDVGAILCPGCGGRESLRTAQYEGKCQLKVILH